MGRLHILVCACYAGEVSKIRKYFPDVDFSFFPVRCEARGLLWEDVMPLLARFPGCSRAELIGSSCLDRLGEAPALPYPVGIRRLDQCFNMVADKAVIDTQVAAGDYLVSPGWLGRWREGMSRWGFDEPTAKAFFAESVKRVLLIQTVEDGPNIDNLSEFSSFIGRPYSVLQTGILQFESFILSVVMEWRSQWEPGDERSVVADYAMALDLLRQLSLISDEAEVKARIAEIMLTLFAPRSVIYADADAGGQATVYEAFGKPMPAGEEARLRLRALSEDHRWTPSGTGFVFRIAYQENVLGFMEIDGVAFPAALERYLKLVLSISGIFGLCINNARTYDGIRRAQAELKEANLRLEAMSAIDGLTGLANRRRFDEHLENAWLRGRRSRSPLSLVICDIDFFKKCNDHGGHLAGDDILRRIARTLGACAARPDDLAARYGGEEFALVLPDTDAGGALHIAESTRAAVEGLGIPHPESSASAYVTMSLGIATLVPSLETTPDDLIGMADAAMYRAKQAGRNRVEASS